MNESGELVIFLIGGYSGCTLEISSQSLGNGVVLAFSIQLER